MEFHLVGPRRLLVGVFASYLLRQVRKPAFCNHKCGNILPNAEPPIVSYEESSVLARTFDRWLFRIIIKVDYM